MTPNRTIPPSSRRLRSAGIAALLIAITLAAFGIFARSRRDSELRAQVETDAVPTVSIVAPGRDATASELVLPGSVQAYYDAPIYARVPGYLKKWYVDIGAHVKAGAVLAEIETPEIDQQLRQAQADLATAVAKEKLAQTTSERWQNML
ncbi:MAG TPA: biotin/lipoyl-binding protein, partial [Rudaea sp.]